MLGKWLVSSNRCEGCAPDDIDVVVVPSFLFHCFARHGGPFWDLFYSLNAQTTDERREQGALKYWKQVRDTYGHYGRGRALIVVHQSFTPDTPAAQMILSALSEQPPDFTSRVVIASLESNLRLMHKTRMVNTTLARQGTWTETESWSDDASLGLMRRQDTLFGNKLAARPGHEGPLLVSLPYPTGLLNAVSFASSSGVGSRPNCCSICRLMRFNLLIVSIMCTGMRMVRAWSAIERVIAWRIHQVA